MGILSRWENLIKFIYMKYKIRSYGDLIEGQPLIRLLPRRRRVFLLFTHVLLRAQHSAWYSAFYCVYVEEKHGGLPWWRSG